MNGDCDRSAFALSSKDADFFAKLVGGGPNRSLDSGASSGSRPVDEKRRCKQELEYQALGAEWLGEVSHRQEQRY